ncbi:hypothetical protein LTR70_006414 [Exophiala xenobiotica]|uniref:Uncharacterized protein n=1 Tax=Lithohypha guttulata TaxID=1690604 RepID=A0ABR0K2Z3_9EURO|nr:hypothetical protein LTR24_007385 [Lithohypha guttulata]KAK5316246.1 hypothetical protein LTR70_006414 [Exophiala xenobiotica]
MDHLPPLSNPVQPLPNAPFLEDRHCVYRGPIETFGWQHKRLSQTSGIGPDLKYSGFIQQWLYFGLLTDFFALWGFELLQTDFVVEQNGSRTITNRMLPDYMVAYLAREFNQEQSLLRDKRASNLAATYTSAQKKEANKRLNRGLELFKFVYDRLLHVVDLQAIEPAIYDSVILLTATLVRFWQIVYGSLRLETVDVLAPDFSIFRFRSIPDLRTQAGFCAHERRLLLDLVDGRLNDIAFFSLLGPNDDKASHSSCGANGCKAYQIDPASPYHTAHTPECGGNCSFIGLDEDFWIRKVEERRMDQDVEQESWMQSVQGKLPDQFTKQAIGMTFDNGQLNHHDIPLMKARTAGWLKRQVADWNMVVFSHVWADGLGNPGSNTLPSCQLRRLQNLANSVYGTAKTNVPFWFDTLLIPVKRKDFAEEFDVYQRRAEAKQQALRDMEWVYKYASKVLVLDRRLFSLDSSDMQPEEIGARIMTSVWSRRLWTLQEGASKDKTCFRFRDRWIHWPDLHNQVLDRGGLSNWRYKHSRLPEGHPLSKQQKINLITNKKCGQGSNLDGTAGNATTSPMVEAMKADKRLYKITSPNWHSIYRFLEEMTIDWSGSPKAEVLPRCVRGMYYRNCSVVEDEALVLASMVSSTPGLAAKLTHETKDNKAERCKKLLQSKKEVPEDFLFMDQRRYEGRGERWMPRSLLSVSAVAYRPPSRTEALPKRHNMSPKWFKRRNSVLAERTDDGIKLGLRGVKLLPCPRAFQAPFRLRWDYKYHKEVQSSYFQVSFKEPGTNSWHTDFPEGNWVLIFERTAGYTDEWAQARAALVNVSEWFGQSWYQAAGGKGDFVALAFVTRLTVEEFENSALPLVESEEPQSGLNAKMKPLDNAGRMGAVQKWVVG